MLFCLKINKSSSTLEYLSFALCLRCCLEITDGSRYGEVVNWSQVVSISDSPRLRIAHKEGFSIMTTPALMDAIVTMEITLMMSTMFM